MIRIFYHQLKETSQNLFHIPVLYKEHTRHSDMKLFVGKRESIVRRI